MENGRPLTNKTTLWELEQHCQTYAKISTIGVQQAMAIKTLELLQWYDEAMARIDVLEKEKAKLNRHGSYPSIDRAHPTG